MKHFTSFDRVYRPYRLLWMMVLVLGFASLAGAAPQQARVKHVVIISFDQAAPRKVKAADNMPTFQQMAREGAVTWEAYTIVPSITLPSHTSMVTGVGIQKHQITWNNYQPKKGVVRVPTIFSLAREKGFRTAMYAGKEKFKHLNQPDSLDHFEISGGDLDVGKAFARDFPSKKYDLVFLHFPDIDSMGHRFGQGSPEWLQALADADTALKIVRDTLVDTGVSDETVVILTADHGGHNVKQEDGSFRASHGSAEPKDTEIPWVAWGKGVKPGFEITAPVLTYDTSATALWLLGVPVPDSFWGRPVTSAFEE